MAYGRRRAGLSSVLRRALGKRKRPSRKGRVRMSKRAKKGSRKTRTRKGSSIRNRGDGILGHIVKCNITHRKGVTYEKSERFDTDHATGAGICLSTTGAQGVYSRTWWNGELTNSGTDVAGNWSLHGVNNPNFQRKMKTTHLDMQCVSASTGIQEATVYIVRANRDTGALTNGTTNPLGAWEQCAINVPATQFPTVIGETPYVPGFGQYWKIIKKQKLVLNPGQCFRIRVHTKEDWAPMWAHIGKAIENPTAGYTNVKGRTYGVMIVNKGMPVSDAGNATLVNYGSAKINLTWRWTVQSTVADHFAINRTVVANLLDPLNTISNPVEVGDDDGMRIVHTTA